MSSNTLTITPRYVKGVGAKATTAQTDQTGNTATNIVTAYTAAAASAPGSTEGQVAQVFDVVVTVPVTSAAAVWIVPGRRYWCATCGSGARRAIIVCQ